MMKVDFKTLAEALKISRVAVLNRAQRENWQFTEETGLGGKRKLFNVTDLPKEVARRITIFQQGTQAKKELAVVQQVRDGVTESLLNKQKKAEASLMLLEQQLSVKAKARFDGRYEIVKDWQNFYHENQPMGKKVSYVVYAAAFNANETQIASGIRDQFAPLKARSIERWVGLTEKEGMSSLIDAWNGKAKKDVNVFTSQPLLKDTTVNILIARPTISMKNLTELLGTAAVDAETGEVLFNAPSYWATTRFCNGWKEKNAEFYMAATNPDEWKNKKMVAFGSASEDVVRLNQRWEMDATPADWMLQTEDGGLKRYSVSVIIDVYSRRSLMVLSPTPRAETHKLALRLAILQWGIPEEIVTDNGKDYISRNFLAVLDALNIVHHRTNPFSPWEKPFVERMNQTMLYSILEAYSSFIGHSVSERSAIEARASFAERLFSKDAKLIEMAMPAHVLQERINLWLSGTYEQDMHSGIGMSPFAKAISWNGTVKRIQNERALDVLLAPPAGKGTYIITKKGLTIDKAQFLAMELALLVGQSVQVYLTDDFGQVVVYHEGKFICVARCPERTGISRQEIASKARQMQRENIAAQRKAAKSTKIDTDVLIDRYLQDKGVAAGKLSVLPQPSKPYKTAALDASGDAAKKLDGAVEKTQIPADLQIILNRQNSGKEQAPIQNEAASNITVIPETPQLRFKKWLELDQLLQQGELIDDATLTRWYGTYAQSNEHVGLMKRHAANTSAANEKRNTAATVLRLNNQTL